VEVYLDHLREAVDIELSALGDSGSIELFAFIKRFAHRGTRFRAPHEKSESPGM
jgi:hypothetical protein